MAMIKNEKMITQNRTEKNLADMAESRIITKNLVYVIGLSARIATKETLIKKEYFGQYGTITKVVVNNNKAYNQNNPKGPSYSAYVTYAKPYEASIAILSLDNIIVDDHLIRASFGTTKYCSFYLKRIECTNKECLFLHKLADPNDIISREDLNGNKNIFMEQQLYAMKIADVYNGEVKKKLNAAAKEKRFKSVLPSPENIYTKDIVKDYDPLSQKNKMTKKKYYEDANIINTQIDNTSYKNSLRNIFQHENGNLNMSVSSSISNNMIKEKESINIKYNKLNNVLNNNRQKYLSADSTSTSSKEDINYTNSAYEDKNSASNINTLLVTPKKNLQKLFYIRDSSRFKFKENKTDSSLSADVPNFIQNIILKKSQTYILARSMRHLEDFFFSDKSLHSEFMNKNHWAQFILENKSESVNKEDDDKDLIDDIDYIINMILHKCHAYK